MTHPSPTLEQLERRDAERLVELMLQRQSLTSFREEVFPGRSIQQVRKDTLSLASRDTFVEALQKRMPPAMHDVTQTCWIAWLEQDERDMPRKTLGLLRQLVHALGQLAETLRAMQQPQERATHNDRQEVVTWS